MTSVREFRIETPERDLTDLAGRLRRTRWPERETDRSQGVPLEYLRELCAYWADGYDWRSREAWLNTVPQFVTEIDGLDIHFVRVRSPHPGALPLVLTHGWPGSFVEFLAVIPALTDPPDAADAFDVICPSLPGYAFSGKPATTGWGVERIAAAWATLMTRLGYDRYAAAGSDWGTSVTAQLGRIDAGRLAGIHLVPPLAPPDPSTLDDLTWAEEAALADLRRAGRDEDGYSLEQSTRPQTIGYALTDSPAALCAWIVEKFWAWSDHPGDLHAVIDRDRLLDNVMLYWLTGTGASAARLYWESFRHVQRIFTESAGDLITVPAGCSVFPKENPRPSRRWAARRFTDIRYWGEPERGGHFAALEQPELFVRELRSFFRLVC
ncbi:MAG: epoxide hydrolase [Hamadaea sp.]|uniref:epoxide hydrolase family protein n=1 Tax=Hamadaea sp. TaxID=2024425 RepID=UPI0017DE1047|nr:epoxide hydrolase family protein [Hamadaea sp.]NUR70455.1 epoxide hydrolase [Hamadaea sp.]NUT20045.1 epoxide hydrolase [Hamadaea sp.]